MHLGNFLKRILFKKSKKIYYILLFNRMVQIFIAPVKKQISFLLCSAVNIRILLLKFQFVKKRKCLKMKHFSIFL